MDKEEHPIAWRGVAWRGVVAMGSWCVPVVGWCGVNGVCSGTHTASICTYNTIDIFCTHMFLDVHV